MTEHMGEQREARWGKDRRGIGSVTATVILGVVVVAVGAVGYVVLNALEHASTTSSTVRSYSCTPPTLPQCADHPAAAESGSHAGAFPAAVVTR